MSILSILNLRDNRMQCAKNEDVTVSAAQTHIFYYLFPVFVLS